MPRLVIELGHDPDREPGEPRAWRPEWLLGLEDVQTAYERERRERALQTEKILPGWS